MKNVAAFLRSVIPADPAQLLFLAGTVCLVAAPRLSWWPARVAFDRDHATERLTQEAMQSIGVALRFPLLFAGIAAYFICFWPGPRPIRRILTCVYLPVVPALVAMCWLVFHFAAPYRSVLETTVPHTGMWLGILKKMPGVQFGLLGLLLIGIFTVRLSTNKSSLPLALPNGSKKNNENPEAWRRVKILVWVLVGPMFLYALLMVPLTFSARFLSLLRNSQFVRIATVLDGLVVLGIAFCIVGRSDVRQVLRRTLRLPGEKYALLAAAFAIGIPTLISTGQYLFERAQLVRHDVSTYVTPEPGAYFSFPDGWLLLLFLPALCEEIIFRGWLQTRFVSRYGLNRGIFLVGIVWAAFHFPSDFAFSHLGTWGAIQTVVFRLFMAIALSSVLGWLTLETGSVLAAALAHTFYNVLMNSELGPFFLGKYVLTVSLWAVLGWILFRYWPVTATGAEEAVPQLVSPESAP
jgi:membrane protease YdiL (CAAX protease family)